MRSDVRLTGARGAIAIQFAMLAFGFFALAAVVIDVRLASLAQQQMQVAADFAALEGLYERGFYPAGDPRVAARETVRRVFDDDLRPANGDPMKYGAGPLLALTGGQPGSNGSALVTVTAPGVYDPVLELNTANARSGDIVLGRYVSSDTAHFEAADYSRTDFVPTPALSSTAVLVRLRRTADATGLDRVPGVSSSGPPLPFLFGLASTMHAEPGSSYNPRTDGLSVSATSIAATRRALEIAGPGPNYGYTTLQTFVLFSAGSGVPAGQPFPRPPGQPYPAGSPLFVDFWDTTPAGTPTDVIVRPDGYLERIVGGVGSGRAVGYVSRILGTQDSPVTRVGQIADIIAYPFFFPGETFVPIARSVSGNMKAIGFGWVGVEDISAGAGPPRARIYRGVGGLRIGGPNAVSVPALAALAADPALVVAHAGFPDAITAPVLVR